ncbi:hypothetical protein [Thalassotalea piscium]|uniref:Glycosyltransferase subfamily 4-like N-terminal domain-containing protein n=1 Tax=Thalassotalea piscium TaxID=1230533 RepID=A0A7X0NEF2_9GAMM|nr:hypothetical protein [Thalassotalea piscium]MBB6541923.1 hypothetical protein [Thalassotalea piscium]
MANILIISSEFLPMQSSGINRISFMKRFLESQGHHISVLTTSSEAQGIVRNTQFDTSNNIFRAYSLSKLHRRLLSSRKLPIYPKFAYTGKYATWQFSAITKGKKLVKELGIDCIFVSFPDFASMDVATRIAKATSTRLDIDFRDPPYWFFSEPVNSASLTTCKSIVNNAIATCKNIYTSTEQSKNILTSYYNITQETTVIGNGYDKDIIDNLPPRYKPHRDHIEIVHIGSFYPEGRDIMPLIKELETVSAAENTKFILRLIGDPPSQKAIHQFAHIAETITISIEDPLPAKKALIEANNADILLLIQGPTFNKQIPAKAYEYIALNNTILAIVGLNGATQKLLEQYPENVNIADYEEKKSIRETILRAVTHRPKIIDTNNLSRQEQVKLLSCCFK